jgi:hypothetical protein
MKRLAMGLCAAATLLAAPAFAETVKIVVPFAPAARSINWRAFSRMNWGRCSAPPMW